MCKKASAPAEKRLYQVLRRRSIRTGDAGGGHVRGASAGGAGRDHTGIRLVRTFRCYLSMQPFDATFRCNPNSYPSNVHRPCAQCACTLFFETGKSTGSGEGDRTYVVAATLRCYYNLRPGLTPDESPCSTHPAAIEHAWCMSRLLAILEHTR